MRNILTQEIYNNQEQLQNSYSIPTADLRYQDIPQTNITDGLELDNLFNSLLKELLKKELQNKVNDIDENYKWFVSKKIDLSLYGGKYIGICRKQIIVGNTAVEIKKLAKEKFGQDCKPLITYIPKDMDVMI